MIFEREDKKSLIINIFSSAIWQFIFSIVSSGIITTIINRILFYINKINDLFLIIVTCTIFCVFKEIIEVIIKLISKKYIENNITNNCNLKKDGDNIEKDGDDDIENCDYYFEEYQKSVTVYKNGHGIIINSFTVIVNNVDSFEQFNRKLDISDGRSDACFPKFSEMKRIKLEDRFKKTGFWCDSKEKIILCSKKFNWDDNNPLKESKIPLSDKELRWIFKINKSKIETHKPYHIVYVISIDGMFPIKDGLFNENIANTKETYGQYSSSIHVEHQIKKIIYTISFEHNLDLKRVPVCYLQDGRYVHCVEDDNLLYKKYNFEIKNPQKNSNIIVEWKFNNINPEEDE